MTVAVDQWLAVRRRLNQFRGQLSREAARRYPPSSLTPLLTLSAPSEPVPADDLRLSWASSPAVCVPAPDFLPAGFSSYSAAIGGIDRPALFENRPCYRLLGISGRHLTFGPGLYFDKLDTAEALAHEFCAGGSAFRDRLGDPFDLAGRSVIPDVQTLLVSRDGRFLVQWRDPAKVATNGGVHGLVPTGEFQPSGQNTVGDLDLRRLVAREYAEEVLGGPELVDPPASCYEPFRDVPLFYLGIGMDPLTLAASILTMAVVDSLDDAVDVNAEGRVVRSGLPFTPEAVGRFLREESVAPTAEATLRLGVRLSQ